MTPRTIAELAAWVDTIVTEDVVVIGSPPDEGRDLDLLCGPSAAHQLRAVLRAEGFVGANDVWALPTSTGLQVVDLSEVGSGVVPGRVEAELFARASPVTPLRHVLLPAPHHQLLLLARRLAGTREGLTERKRSRVEALSANPDTVGLATTDAPDWGASRGLAQLLGKLDDVEPSRLQRTRARLEREMAGTALVVALSRAVVPRRRRSAVIAFCGLDGSGKTTQARCLVEALESMGLPAAHCWSRLTYDPAVERIAAPAKRLARRLKGARAPGDVDGRQSSPPGAGPGEPADGHGSRAVGTLWTVALVLVHALGHRRQRRRARGATLVWDRYVVDAVVQLRTDYAARAWVGPAERILRWMSPVAVVTFFLDVPPTVAAARKDDFDEHELAAHRAAYLDALGQMVAVTVDGTRPPEEIAPLVVREALRALGAH